MLGVVAAYRTPRTSRVITIRVGVHVGRILGAVMGSTMPRYQLFGASMDYVQEMEGSSMPGRVHMSKEFAAVLRDGGRGQLVVDELGDGTAFLATPNATRTAGGSVKSTADLDATPAGSVFAPLRHDLRP